MDNEHGAAAGLVREGLRGEEAEHWQVSFDALLGIFAEGGCPLCRLSVRAARELIVRMLTARRLPTITLPQVRSARGFCTPHAWGLWGEAVSRALRADGLSRAVREVLAETLEALQFYASSRVEARLDPTVFKRTIRHSGSKRLVRKLTTTGKCPLCLMLRRFEEVFGYQVLALLGQEELRKAYGQGSALCLPHFRWALAAVGEKVVLDRLVEVERACLESLLGDHEGRGFEEHLAHVAGHPHSMAGA